MSGGWRAAVVVMGLAALVLTGTTGCGVTVRTGTVDVGGGGFEALVEGSGVEATQTRGVPEFHAVEIHHAFETTIEVGGEPGVEITGDDNLLELVVTEVHDGRLVLRVDDSYSTEMGLRARITTSALNALDLSGSSTARVTGVSESEFQLEVGGAASAVVGGSIGALALSTSGSSRAEVSGLSGGELTAEMSGASRAVVSGAIGAVELEASGSTELVVTGVAGGHVQMDLNGAVAATVSGRAESLGLDASGSSRAHLGALLVADAEVDLAGAARADVHATRLLEGFVSGAGQLTFSGSPTALEVESAGAGTFRSK
jgi:hypothetical protein